MLRVLKVVVVSSLVIILVAGICLFLFPNKVIPLFMPSIEQISDISADVKKDTAYVTTKLVAKNNTFLSIKMDTLKYKISFSNKIYFQNKQALGMMIKRYNKDTFEFSFKVPYTHILADMKHERERKDSTNFLTNLSLQYSTFFGKAELPIAESGMIKIPEPPQIEIQDVKFKKQLESKNILAEVRLKVVNNSVFSLKIKKVSYAIRIQKFASVKGSYTKELSFKGNTKTNFSLPVEIELKNHDQSLMSILRSNDTYHYVLVVDGIINSSNFKQEHSTKLRLIKEDDVMLMQ